MRTLGLLAMLIAGIPSVAMAAGDVADCAQDADANLKLAGCGRLIATHPSLAAAFSGRGDALVTLGQPDRAIADYTRAIALDPKLAAAFYNRALAYLAEGDAAAATADFDAVIGLNGSDPTAYNGRGMANAALGKLDAADADFGKAVALDPSYARAYLSRATLNLRRGRTQQAVADFDAVLRLHPGDQDASVGRAIAMGAGAPQDAETVGSTSETSPPVSPTTRHRGLRAKMHRAPDRGTEGATADNTQELHVILNH